VLYGVSATYCCISGIRVALALKLDSEVSFNLSAFPLLLAFGLHIINSIVTNIKSLDDEIRVICISMIFGDLLLLIQRKVEHV
jgi:hypothetical protein